MEPYNSTVIRSGSQYCPSLLSPLHITSLGNASVLSTRIMTHPSFVFVLFFFQLCKTPLKVILHQGGNLEL